MKVEIKFLLEIISCILNDEIEQMAFPDMEINWEKLFKFAENHSLLNLVYYGLKDTPKDKRPEQEAWNSLYLHAMQEVAKSYNQIAAAEELMHTFEKEGIYVLAVKGICTKHRYPEYDMRTMGDIDVLYKASQQSDVRRTMKHLGYARNAEERKHDSYLKLPFVGVEMHRTLVAADSAYSSYYENVWERVQPREGCKYICEMRPEDEYIFTIVHLVEHFQNGGIGIRFIMDIYVYNREQDIDWTYVEQELRKIGLWEFYEHLSHLAQKWFGVTMEYTEGEAEILNKLEDYIIHNGTYGTRRNSAAVSVAKNGRFSFIWRAAFPNLRNMQTIFPWLEKWPILLPYAWVLRAVRSVLYRRDNIKTQVDRYKYGDKEYGEELKGFFKMCGL